MRMTLMKMDTDEHGFYRSKLRKGRGMSRKKMGGNFTAETQRSRRNAEMPERRRKLFPVVAPLALSRPPATVCQPFGLNNGVPRRMDGAVCSRDYRTMTR